MNEMTQEREGAILEKAIATFGPEAQVIVAIEECSELIKALTKWLRAGWDADPETGEAVHIAGAAFGVNIKEEMADVSIMLNQLALIFGDANEEELSKLERLEKLLEGSHVQHT